MGKELEVKYTCTNAPAAMTALQNAYPGQWQTVYMASTYYDTEEQNIRCNRWTLRLRMENDTQVITCKTPGEKGARNEWEAPAGSLEEGIEKILTMGAPAMLSDLYKKGLGPVCGARFTRRRKQIHDTFGKAELALDEGLLTGGSREQHFMEIEVELKEGNEEAFLQWCQSFRDTYGLRPETKSKYARASALREM